MHVSPGRIVNLQWHARRIGNNSVGECLCRSLHQGRKREREKGRRTARGKLPDGRSPSFSLLSLASSAGNKINKNWSATTNKANGNWNAGRQMEAIHSGIPLIFNGTEILFRFFSDTCDSVLFRWKFHRIPENTRIFIRIEDPGAKVFCKLQFFKKWGKILRK